MTRARSTQISLTETPYYHCVSRCVRRAFLCGTDSQSGKDYHHRKQWIIKRLEKITQVYTIGISAYAIMDNHYHLILNVDTEAAQSLSDQQVQQRWMQLYHGDVLMNRYLNGDCHSRSEINKVKAITQQWRERLSDISWFMRSLNEYIARKANIEDCCKGHFWESRFKSQALLDEQALLSCMAYVDLNPVRAGLSDTLEASEFTSIQQRIQAYAHQRQKSTKTTNNKKQSVTQQSKKQPKQNKQAPNIPLTPFCPDSISSETITKTRKGIMYSLQDYFELTDWTGRAIRADKRGYIPEQEPKILKKLGIDSDRWLENIKQFSERHQRFIGSESQLQDICEKSGQKWLFGLKQSSQLY